MIKAPPRQFHHGQQVMGVDGHDGREAGSVIDLSLLGRRLDALKGVLRIAHLFVTSGCTAPNHLTHLRAR